MGTRRGEMLNDGTIACIDSFSGHGGEGGRGGASAVKQESYGLGSTARSARVRPGYGENDNFTTSQEGQGVAGAAGGVAHREMHGDSTGGARIDRKTTPRGVCDQAGRYFVRRLLQLSGLHLNGQERRGVGKG